MSGDETFLKRWSRLKQEKRGAVEAEPRPEPPEKSVQHAKAVAGQDMKSPPPVDGGDPEVVAKLPPLESLGKDSDYSPFMREGVPQALRLAALRKLWGSDPALAAPEPLDLHNIDYTHLAAPDQVVATSYQAGRGFADKVEESIERVEKERAKDAARAKDEVEAVQSAEPADAADQAETAPPPPGGKPGRPT